MKKTKDKAYINGTKYIHSAFYNDRYVIIYIYIHLICMNLQSFLLVN